jgi:predicted nucleotidyltransferase
MKQYTANEILDLLKSRRDILTRYKVSKIGLFGSHLHKNNKSTSDIDLLVDFEEKTFDNFIELAFELEKLFGRKVDLLTEKGISPYILSFIKDEILWYEAR